MAFPTICYIQLKNGTYQAVGTTTNPVLDITREHLRFYNGQWYRDIIDAADRGNPHVLATDLPQSLGSSASPTVAELTALYNVATGAGSGLSTNNSAAGAVQITPVNGGVDLSADETFNNSDNYTHMPPRSQAGIRTLKVFWDTANPQRGQARTLTGTTTNASTTVTAANADLLEVGQAITGTGIVAGSVITRINWELDQDTNLIFTDATPGITPTTSYDAITTGLKERNRYKAIGFELSLAATAGGTVTLTVSAGTGKPLGEFWEDQMIGWSGTAPTYIS